MKKLLIILVFSLITHFSVAGGLKAYMSYAAFNTPGNQPYLETYLTVKGSSVKHVLNSENKYQGSVEVQIIFRQNDSIVDFAKYELKGPSVSDTLEGFPNFLDIQRFALGNGTFDIELKMKDLNSGQKPLVSLDSYMINFPKAENSFSDIMFLSSYEKSDSAGTFTRNGYFMLPYVFNFFPQNTNALKFYTELYNNKIDGLNENFLLTYYLRPFELDKGLGKFTVVQRKKADKVNSIMGNIDISTLPSGNYYLVVEARNRENELITSKKIFFQRINPRIKVDMNEIYSIDPSDSFVSAINNIDTLKKFISWIDPISTEFEKTFANALLINDTVIENLQKYFLNFWVNRNQLNPLDAWSRYKAVVLQVNKGFSAVNIPGFYTDRGRIFLKYGAPDVISQNYSEPFSYPYEIWHYYVLPDNQKDIKFVFYTHDIATDDFQLIHSNAIGELANYNWRSFINRLSGIGNVQNKNNDVDSWGSKQNDNYNLPR